MAVGHYCYETAVIEGGAARIAGANTDRIAVEGHPLRIDHRIQRRCAVAADSRERCFRNRTPRRAISHHGHPYAIHIAVQVPRTKLRRLDSHHGTVEEDQADVRDHRLGEPVDIVE